MKTTVRKTIQAMAEEIYRRGVDASAQQLYTLVTEVMRENGENPDNVEVRGEIGRAFRALYRRAS